MTISSRPRRRTYVCVGNDGPYTFCTRFLTNEDLAVTRIAADGVRTRLTLADDYAVTGAGDPEGGTVRTTESYADGEIEVWLDVALTQDTAYTPGDAFPAEAHEAALDKLTLIAGQQAVEAEDLVAADAALGERIDDLTAVVASIEVGGSGAGGVGVSAFAFEPDDPANSLAHALLVPGAFYPVGAFDADLQPGSSANWYCFSATPTGTVGDRSYVEGVGLVLEGEHGRLSLVAGEGNEVDVRAAGVKCDATHLTSGTYHATGGTTSQRPLMYALRDWAIAEDIYLTGGGVYLIENGAGLDMQNACLRWGNMLLIAEVGFIGWMVTGPDDMHDTEAYEADLYLWGDNGAFANASAARGFKLNNDGGALGAVRVRGAYLFQGIDLRANAENKRVDAYFEYTFWHTTITDRATFVAASAGTALTVTSVIGPGEIELGGRLSTSSIDYADNVTILAQVSGTTGGAGVYTLSAARTVTPAETMAAILPAGSPDDCHAYIQGHNCKHWLWMADGTDSCVDALFNTQSRTRSDDGIAAVTISTGKNFRAGGLIRAHNGPEDCIFMGKDHGVSACHFDDLVLEHGYANALNLQWVGRLSGRVQVREYDNDNGGGGGVTTVIYGRIAHAGGFHVDVLAAAATYPVQVGEVTSTYFPIDADLGSVTVQRGNPEPFYGTFPSGVGLHLFKGSNFSLDLKQLDGDVKTTAGLSRANLSLCATWLVAGAGSYKFVTGHVTPNLQVRFLGACYGDDIFDKAWLFDAISVENIIDFGASPFLYTDGAWDPVKLINASAVQLGSITGRHNTVMAKAGAQRWDSTNSKVMFKQGLAASSAWKDAAGGSTITPAYQAATETFLDAIVAAGGTRPASASAEKDGIDIVFTALAEEAYTPTAMYWWGLSAAYADAGRAAVRLNMMGSSFGLTENNYSANWSGAGASAGYTGAGTSGGTFYLSGGPAAADVAGQDSIYVLWNTLNQPTSTGVPANFPDFSSPNGYLRGKFRHDAGGSVILNNIVSSPLGFSASAGFAPAMRAGVRYAASGADCIKGFANDRLDVTGTTASSGAYDALEFFRFANSGSPQFPDRTVNFFVIGLKPSNDNQAIRLARGFRRGLRKAGKGTW